MGILFMILIGFLVGLAARFIKPGRDSMGFFLTTILGIAGAVIGGFLGRAMGLYEIGEPAGFIASVLGAMVLLVVIQTLSSRRTA